MSDFDKEAERERLREKYEADTKKREATQHMSDLLLQGATMTDIHCDRCGDPLFRYDGEEFCPTCQYTDGDAEPSADPATQTDHTTRTGTTEETTPEDGTVPVSTPQDTRPPDDTDATESRDTPGRESDSPPSTRRTPPSQTPDTDSTHDPTDESSPSAPPMQGNESLYAVEASVSRTLTRLATQAENAAENTTDLARTRERLAGVREAAEALAAVRNARR